jgi:hypothetical protein
VGALESSKGLGGQVVIAASLYCGYRFAEAGKRERVVALRSRGRLVTTLTVELGYRVWRRI